MRAWLGRGLIIFALAGFGCGDDTNGGAGTGGRAGSGGSGGIDAPQIDAPMIDANISCEALGQSCTSASQCCSGVCNLTTQQCDMGRCFGQAMPCSLPTDCCSNNCTGNVCQATGCTQDGQACS